MYPEYQLIQLLIVEDEDDATSLVVTVTLKVFFLQKYLWTYL